MEENETGDVLKLKWVSVWASMVRGLGFANAKQLFPRKSAPPGNGGHRFIWRRLSWYDVTDTCTPQKQTSRIFYDRQRECERKQFHLDGDLPNRLFHVHNPTDSFRLHRKSCGAASKIKFWRCNYTKILQWSFILHETPKFKQFSKVLTKKILNNRQIRLRISNMGMLLWTQR